MALSRILILGYPILTVLLLVFLGIGITYLLMPKKLQPYILWLSPWYAITIIIVSGVLLSLFGLPMQLISICSTLTLSAITLHTLYIRKAAIPFPKKETAFLSLIMTGSLLLNLYPLLTIYRFPTTLSFGNNDAIVYAIAPDYLVHHSIIESFYSTIAPGAADLFHTGYRWGTPVLAAFFLSLFRLSGYEFVTILQTTLFVLAFPLLYILIKLLYKETTFGILVGLSLLAGNVNILYILYHSFFGQILFLGMGLFIIIQLLIYLEQIVSPSGLFSFDEAILALAFTALYFSYHEGIPFILIPWGIYISIKTIQNIKRPEVRTRIWSKLFKILMLTILFGSLSIVNATVFDFQQANLIDDPIGWEQFRESIPYANPFEMVGLYSLHSFPPLPIPLAIILSVIILMFILYGLRICRYQLFFFSYICMSIFFLTWSALAHQNFWTYNRSLTYTLPVVLTLFTIGFLEFLKKWTIAKLFLSMGIITLVFFNALQLQKRFLKQHFAVNHVFVSLKELQDKNIPQPIYTPRILNSLYPLWNFIWEEYFLYQLSPPPKPPILVNNQLPDGARILLPKLTHISISPKLLLSAIEWENPYYRIGIICSSQQCLRNSSTDLSSVTFGHSEFEDTLILDGWSSKEPEYRWSDSKESRLKLVTKKPADALIFSALSLAEPQEVTVTVENMIVAQLRLSTQPREYVITLPRRIEPDIHLVSFSFSNSYQPANILGTSDTRELSARFAHIRLE